MNGVNMEDFMKGLKLNKVVGISPPPHDEVDVPVTVIIAP